MARVLIVDGDRDIRESLRDLLRLDGYTVLEASTPDQARSILRGCPDCIVVIFDSGAPSTSQEGDAVGIAAVALARINDQTHGQPHQHAFICLTTSPAHLHVRLRDTLGQASIPIIQKPFELDALLAAIAEAAAVVDARNGVR